jgi:hypothetical protein
MHSTNVLLVSDSRNETSLIPSRALTSLSEGSFIVSWAVIRNLLKGNTAILSLLEYTNTILLPNRGSPN